MKKLALIIFSTIIFASCSTTIPPYSSSMFFDYSPLTGSGIFVSESNSVSFEYTALGSIIVTARGGGKINHYSSARSSEDFESIDFNNVADFLKYELIRRKANGIINLKIIYHPKDGTQGAGYTITGMAIRK